MFNSKTTKKGEQTMANNNTQNLETIIGQGTHIKGDMTFSGTMYIEGTIEGSVVAGNNDDTLSIIQTGQVKGSIKAGNLIISGEVEGDIKASGKIEVAASARINGNIHYTNIEMEAGSQVNGQLIYQGSDVITPIKQDAKDGK